MKGQTGFTLLEVIITLLIGATMAAMLVPYMQTNIMESSRPINQLQNVLAIQQVMENFQQYFFDGGTLAALKNSVGQEGLDQTNAFGGYHVDQNRFIKFVNQSEVAATGGDPQDTLKIALSHSAMPGLQLTKIFTAK